MYKIKFYTTPRGDCPIQNFLDQKPKKIQAKFIKLLDVLAGLGPELKRPYAKEKKRHEEKESN